MNYNRGWQTFSMKSQIVKIVCHIHLWAIYISMQLCCHSTKDNTYVNGHGCVPVNLHLQKQDWARFGPWVVVC